MSLWPHQVSAVIVTRVDRDLRPVLDSLPPYDEVLIVDGRARGVFARFEKAQEVRNDVVYFQDDDLILKDHHALLGAFEDDGRFYANMIGPEWWKTCGYTDLSLVGAGSLVPKDLIKQTFLRYLERYDADQFFRRHCDFIFGVLAPWRRLELETEILDSASDDTALWKKPEQMEEKWAAIRRARGLRSVVLTMLTKNEEKNVERAIKSAFGLFDYVLVHDTGSTDDTVATVLRVCDELGVPGNVRSAPWENFGQNRAWLMNEARMYGDYQLMMDADEELIEAPYDWPELSADQYLLHYAGSIDYAQPRLVRSGVQWSWMDNVHAYLGGYKDVVEQHLQKPLIVHHGRPADTSPERIRRDVGKIVALLEENPHDSRAVFNLAKALDGLEATEEAKEAYRLRVEMGGWPEQEWYARYRLGVLTALDDFDAGAEILLQAWRERPWRIEPLRALASFCTQAADLAPYPSEDMLFVHRNYYRQEEDPHGESHRT